MGGREENNPVTLKETSSNEESTAGTSRPIYSCSGERSRVVLGHRHDPETLRAIAMFH